MSTTVDLVNTLKLELKAARMAYADLGPVHTIFGGANALNRAAIEAHAAARIDMRARRVTTSGARFSPFPAGCGQKGPAPRYKALPGLDPGCVLRLAHDLFDEQRVLRK